jgi:hypothetical protein
MGGIWYCVKKVAKVTLKLNPVIPLVVGSATVVVGATLAVTGNPFGVQVMAVGVEVALPF